MNIFHIRKGSAVRSTDLAGEARSHAWLYSDEVAIPAELASLLRCVIDPVQDQAPKSVKDVGRVARQALYNELRTATGRATTLGDSEALAERHAEATRPRTVTLTIEVPETCVSAARSTVELRGWKVVE